jgi:hypothetical protein
MRIGVLAASALIGAWGFARAEEGSKGEAVGEEEETKVVEFVGEQEPDMRKHLEMLKKANPDEHHRKVREIAQMHRDPEIRERFAARARAQRKVRELTQAYRKAEAKEKPGVKEKLRAALSALFEEDMAQKELHLKKMQAEISKLKERIAKRRSLKDKVVDKRLERMLGEEDEWED